MKEIGPGGGARVLRAPIGSACSRTDWEGEGVWFPKTEEEFWLAIDVKDSSLIYKIKG